MSTPQHTAPPHAGAWPTPTRTGPTMTAVTFREFGGPEVLTVETVPTPVPGPDEVLIRVGAVSVGRLLDLVARSGHHPYATFTFPHILGAEHAGVVVAAGAHVSTVALGARVATFPVITDPSCPLVQSGYDELSPTLEIIGTHRPGAYAQYVAVPAVNVFPVPAQMSPADAVAVALAGPVAMNQLLRAGYRTGQRVIVQGATSALGSTTALLAKHLRAEVIVSSRQPAKRERLRELGFDNVLDSASHTFADDVRAAFAGSGADIVIDNLGDPLLWSKGMAALAPGGAMVSSGAFLGHDVTVDLQRLYSRGLRIIGVRTGNRAAAVRLWEEVRAGFRSVIDRTFPLAAAAEAHRYVESSANVGRVALLVD
ncbi:zinc-binding dehydrogenase [Rhodococcus opacus]|uniref:zinc-binding dehydrogenase n=1 Tax=Rhodococcus opacus TaxID=37919 RepID=UPI00211EB7A3|nr:zinc-binding dehydrogenase [Rhodococcus opacus]